MTKGRRLVLGIVLAAMALTFLGQLVAGFSRPVNVVIGVLSGTLTLILAGLLWRTRRKGTAD